MRRFYKNAKHWDVPDNKRRLLACLAVPCFALIAFAANSSAQDRLYASPEFEGGNHFRPSEFAEVELPVALGGFCPVTLRNKHEWMAGHQRQMLVYDGQIYWFASARERGIFAASPTHYAPVLGGDCVVTLADTGERLLGKLEYAIEHSGRLYMFASRQNREQFQSNPKAYLRADLANDGFCLVSEIDSDKQIAGMPETTVMVDGMRYMFAGDYQRRKFAANIRHYGVERHLLTRPANGAPELRVSQTPSGSNKKEEAKPLKDESAHEVADASFAMDGYCPVTIHQRNIWVRGSLQFQSEYQGRTYLLSGEAEKNRFELSPTKFAPVMGGDCVVSKIDDGLQAAGSIYFAVFDPKSKQMYLFAGADQKAAFNKSPQRYIKLLKASEAGAGEEVPSATGNSQQTPAQPEAQGSQ